MDPQNPMKLSCGHSRMCGLCAYRLGTVHRSSSSECHDRFALIFPEYFESCLDIVACRILLHICKKNIIYSGLIHRVKHLLRCAKFYKRFFSHHKHPAGALVFKHLRKPADKTPAADIFRQAVAQKIIEYFYPALRNIADKIVKTIH